MSLCRGNGCIKRATQYCFMCATPFCADACQFPAILSDTQLVDTCCQTVAAPYQARFGCIDCLRRHTLITTCEQRCAGCRMGWCNYCAPDWDGRVVCLPCTLRATRIVYGNDVQSSNTVVTGAKGADDDGDD